MLTAKEYHDKFYAPDSFDWEHSHKFAYQVLLDKEKREKELKNKVRKKK